MAPRPSSTKPSGSNHITPRCAALDGVLLLRGELDGAEVEYREAIRLNPEDAAAHGGLGLVLHDQADPVAAEAEFGEAIRLDPEEVIYVFHRSINRIAAEWACDVADLRGVIDRKQWKGEMPLYASLVGYGELSLAGRFEEARAWLDEAAEKGDAATWPMAVVQHLRGQVDEAALMAEAGDDVGRLTEVHGYLGVEGISRGRKKEGRVHLDWVVENGKKDFIEYGLALAVLRRLEARSTPSIRLEEGLPEELFARP